MITAPEKSLALQPPTCIQPLSKLFDMRLKLMATATISEGSFTTLAHVTGGDQPVALILAFILEKKGRNVDALDLVYDLVDEMMLAGDFEKLSGVLAALPVNKLSTRILLALLTASLPGKDKLLSRADFAREVRAQLYKRGEMTDGLLDGLD